MSGCRARALFVAPLIARLMVERNRCSAITFDTFRPSQATHSLGADVPLAMRAVAVAVVWLGILSAAVPDTWAQGVPGLRKVTERVVPAYPDLARRLHLRGTVRVEVSVLPDGAVKSAKVLGGNPVLTQSALEAVRRWKFAAGPRESTELVELRFDQK
jgi:TonB family protein